MAYSESSDVDPEARSESLRRITSVTQRLARLGGWDWHIPSGKTFWSDELFRIYGLEPDSGVPGFEEHDRLIHPEDLPQLKLAIARGLEEGAYEARFRLYRHNDGALRYVHARGEVQFDADGNPERLIGYAQDVTEDYLQQEFLQAIFDHSLAAIIVADDAGNYLSVNGAAADLFGLAVEDLVGRNVAEMPIRGSSGPPAEHWASYRKAGQEMGEIEVERANGETRIARYLATRLSDNSHLSLLTDITEHRQLESALSHAQKMEAVGRLAGGVAHDFNNLLTVITNCAELATDELAEAHPARDDLEQIRTASDRAVSLIKQLLAFSRRQVLQPEVIDLNALLAETERMVARTIGEHIRVQLSLSSELATVFADSGQLVQVLMNLVVNARDAMPNGGTLTLKTGMVIVDEVPQPDAVAAGPYVQLTVGDTGEGMDEDTVDQAFEPFFTTKPRGKGTGLGLATVYGIVRQSGGGIRIDSALGEGTSVHVLLPCSTEIAPSASPRQDRPVAEDLGGDEKVLIVEDEAAVRQLLERALSNAGYHVRGAADGVEALSVWEAEQPFDLVLTDLVMPNLGGRELVERLWANRPEQPVVFMTGYSDQVLVGQLNDDAVVLRKPFGMDKVLRALREVLDAGLSP